METKLKPSFLDQVANIPACGKINECVQCGVCSGSCTTAAHWEHTPRKIIAMVRAGLKDEVLNSSSIWYCVSCYLCTARCPRDIKPANIMHALEAIALNEGYKPPTKTTTMYRSFARSIEQNGRIYEFGFMLEYFLKTNPFAALKMLPMAFSLLTHGRMPLLPKAVEGRHQLNQMFRNITTGGSR